MAERRRSTKRRPVTEERESLHTLGYPKLTMTNKFYAGSHIMTSGVGERNGWLRTYGEAVAQAKKRLAADPKLESVPVVQIVCIVRRPEPSMIVEEVRD